MRYDGAIAYPERIKRRGMRVANLNGVMATVIRIRWFLTLSFLEVAVRVVLLSALFMRGPAPNRRLPAPRAR